MISLDWLRAELESLGLFAEVGETVDAANAIAEFRAHTPAAYVSTSGERARPNELSSGGFRQRVTGTVSVLFVLASERRLQNETDVVEATRKAIRDKLLGRTPAGADGPLQFVSYSLRAMDSGLVWGELLFAAPYYLTRA